MEKTSTKIVTIDGEQLPTMSRFYQFISRELQFPEHFGHNLDALLDSLCDLAHLNVDEVVLNIEHAPKFLGKARRGARESVWEIFEEATLEENRYDSVRFRVERD